MNAIRSLFSAFANLAAALNAMAATVTVANDRLREQIDLSPSAPQLPHEAEVIENGDGKRRAAKAR